MKDVMDDDDFITEIKITRKLCYRKDDRAMREPLRRYTTGCGDMAISAAILDLFEP